MKRRSQMEILVDIIKVVAKSPQKPTRIMYKANLSWKRLKNHLSFLLKHGLITTMVAGDRTLYTVTGKGKEVIQYFYRIEKILNYEKKVMPTELWVSAR